MSTHLTQGWRLARRELRGGLKSLRIVLACLALGVAAIAAVGTLRAATEAGLAADGARLLGGDIELRTGQRPAPQAAKDWAAARGATVSEIVEMRAMAIAASGERSLVELKAVDTAYPLYGELVLAPAAASLEARDGRFGVALDVSVAERLGIRPGDPVRMGDATFTFAAVIATEPDRVASPTVLGPRALVLAAAIPATGLVQPGSLISYDTRLRLPPGAEPRAFARDWQAAAGDAGWRIRFADQAEPGVNRFLDRAASFLTLAGLTALLVGGIGVATGVRAWLEARGRTIATLRCLGAPAGTILATYLIQVLVLAAIGISIGLVAGFGLTWLAAQMLAGALPVPPRLGVYPEPLALAALYGLLTALAFALWPLGRAQRIPGAALFRDTVTATPGWPGRGIMIANAVAALALAALVVGTAEQPAFALGFVGGAALTPAAVPARRERADGGGTRAARRAPAGLAAGPGQPAPARRADAGDAGGARHRADDAGRHRDDRGEPAPAACRPVAERGAVLLLHRHPERPGARLRPAGAGPARRRRRPPRAQPAAPHRRGGRRAGRAGAGDRGDALGAARRPRPDLCRDAARGHAAGRRAVVGGRL
jgi:putative ABC transport system permease protein